jgi:hypothetical protein
MHGDFSRDEDPEGEDDRSGRPRGADGGRRSCALHCGPAVIRRSVGGHPAVGNVIHVSSSDVGGLQLERGDSPLDAVESQRKALALLAVLAVHGSVGRERLLALLWPESTSSRARGSLKQLVHVLRKQLSAPDLLEGTAELRLNADRIDSDVQAFLLALREGRPAEAVERYGGPFLDGVHIEAGAEFERWVDGWRSDLENLHREALETLAVEASARGDVVGAVAMVAPAAGRGPSERKGGPPPHGGARGRRRAFRGAPACPGSRASPAGGAGAACGPGGQGASRSACGGRRKSCRTPHPRTPPPRTPLPPRPLPRHRRRLCRHRPILGRRWRPSLPRLPPPHLPTPHLPTPQRHRLPPHAAAGVSWWPWWPW